MSCRKVNIFCRKPHNVRVEKEVFLKKIRERRRLEDIAVMRRRGGVISRDDPGQARSKMNFNKQSSERVSYDQSCSRGYRMINPVLEEDMDRKISMAADITRLHAHVRQ